VFSTKDNSAGKCLCSGVFSAGASWLCRLDRVLRFFAIFLVVIFVYLLGSGKLAGLVARGLPTNRDRSGALPVSRVTAGFRHSGDSSNSRIFLGAGQFDFNMQHTDLSPELFAGQWLEEQLRQGGTSLTLPEQFQILDTLQLQKIVAVQTPGGLMRLLFCRRDGGAGGSACSQIEFNLNDLSKLATQDLARGDFGIVNTAQFGEYSEALLGSCRMAWDSPGEDDSRTLIFSTEVSGLQPDAALREAERVLQDSGFQTMPPVSAQLSLPRTIVAFRGQRHCQVQATEYQGKTTLIYRFE